MKLAQRYSALFVLALVVGCAGNLMPLTPEGKIQLGANSVAASATLGGVLLKNGKITKPQAQSYSAILHTISGHLDTSGVALFACRKSTGSTSKSVPDPCVATAADDIALALSLADDISKTLKAKE